MSTDITTIPAGVAYVISQGFYGMQQLGACFDDCCIVNEGDQPGQFGNSIVVGMEGPDGEQAPAWGVVYHNGEWSYRPLD